MSDFDMADVERAVEILRRSGLVAYPTDTVYGLAVVPADDAAVEKLFAAKQRRPEV
jgi:L-threonylcarbamoyladenylate synthase